MKMVEKMTLAFPFGTSAILALDGVFELRREITLFESNSVRDHRSLGRTLRSESVDASQQALTNLVGGGR